MSRRVLLACLGAAALAGTLWAGGAYMDPDVLLREPSNSEFVVAENPLGGMDMVAIDTVNAASSVLLSHYNPYVGDWDAPMTLDSLSAIATNPRLFFFPSGESIVTFAAGGRIAFIGRDSSSLVKARVSPPGLTADKADILGEGCKSLADLGIEIPGLSFNDSVPAVMYRWDGTLPQPEGNKVKSFYIPVYQTFPDGSSSLARQIYVELREDIPIWAGAENAPVSSAVLLLREDIPIWRAGGGYSSSTTSSSGTSKPKDGEVYWKTVRSRRIIVSQWDNLVPMSTESVQKVVSVGIREDIPIW